MELPHRNEHPFGDERSGGEMDRPAGYHDDRVGTLVAGTYRVHERLGKGGMSAVYRAIGCADGREYAVKFLDRRYTIDPDMARRCQREAKAMAALANRHIPHAYDVGSTEKGDLYLVMEFLRGLDLERVVSLGGPLAWSRVASIALQLCDALAVAHANNIIHRDVKPSNCFLVESEGPGDLIKLIDFGIARDLDASGHLTGTGMVLGTPGYVAPEMVSEGAQASPLTDVYALGVTLYRLLCGRMPWPGCSALELAYHQQRMAPRSLSEQMPSGREPLPIEASKVIMRAFSLVPTDRYHSVQEFGAALQVALVSGERMLRLEPIGSPAPGDELQGRSPGAWEAEAGDGSGSGSDRGEASEVETSKIAAREVEPDEVVASEVSLATTIPRVPPRPTGVSGEPPPSVSSGSFRRSDPQIARYSLVLGTLVLFALIGISAVRPRPADAQTRVALPDRITAPRGQEAKPPPPVENVEQEPLAPAPVSGGSSPVPRRFSVAEARKVIAEQAGYLSKTCASHVNRPSLTFTMSISPGGRFEKIERGGTAEFRRCASELFRRAYFHASDEGGRVDYRLSLAGNVEPAPPLLR